MNNQVILIGAKITLSGEVYYVKSVLGPVIAVTRPDKRGWYGSLDLPTVLDSVSQGNCTVDNTCI